MQIWIGWGVMRIGLHPFLSSMTLQPWPSAMPGYPPHLDGLEVLEHLLLLEVHAPKQHVQVAGLVQAVLHLAALEVLDRL